MPSNLDIGPNTPPLQIFSDWITEAKNHPHINDAIAMSVATCGANGELHSRVVLCKQWSEEGFTFFTNYNSQKGRNLAERPEAAAGFFWDPLARQIKISGAVKKTSREVSVAYWNSRPRESQLSQWLSHQSQPVDSRKTLEEAWSKADKHFGAQPIPCPEHWGGYLIEPRQIEFWVGQPGRLHDRFEFKRESGAWTFRRLYP